jgi:hypothetical protein
MPKLIQLSAFYRNDRPDGIGITLNRDFGNLDSMLEILQATYTLMWTEAQASNGLPELISDLRDQLDCVARQKPSYSIQSVCLVIGNVWALEHFGQLKTDDVNGLFLAYAED